MEGCLCYFFLSSRWFRQPVFISSSHPPIYSPPSLSPVATLWIPALVLTLLLCVLSKFLAHERFFWLLIINEKTQLKSEEGSLLFSFFVPISFFFFFRIQAMNRWLELWSALLSSICRLSSPTSIGPLLHEDEDEMEMEECKLKPLLVDCDCWTSWSSSNDAFNIFGRT